MDIVIASHTGIHRQATVVTPVPVRLSRTVRGFALHRLVHGSLFFYIKQRPDNLDIGRSAQVKKIFKFRPTKTKTSRITITIYICASAKSKVSRN